MAARRHGLFGRRKAYTGESRRPVSLRSKLIYGTFVVSVAFYAVALSTAAQTDGEVLKLYAGGGFGLLLLSMGLLVMAVRRARDESEPVPARIAAILLSLVSAGLWLHLYVVGMVNA